MKALLGINDLAKALRERLVSGVVTLPVLPGIAAQVIDLFNQADPDPKKLIKLVSKDPVLAGHLVKVANCPIIRATAPIVSLQQAIARLGMRMVSVTTLSACLGPKLFRAPAYSSVIDHIWQESLATGVWAREIARALRKNSEVAFLSGLMHQIGKPVALQAIQEIDGVGSTARSIAQIEGLLHDFSRLAGTRVAMAWNLPELIAEPILYWHDFQLAPTSRDLVAMVAVARRFAAMSTDPATTLEPEIYEYPEFRELQLDSEKSAPLLAQRHGVQTLIKAMAI